jgi:hypothetical protein
LLLILAPILGTLFGLPRHLAPGLLTPSLLTSHGLSYSSHLASYKLKPLLLPPQLVLEISPKITIL